MPFEPRANLPPSRVLWLALLVSLATALLCLELAHRQPYLGLRLQADEAGPVRITHVAPPADRVLRSGDAVQALAGAGGVFHLERDDLAAEPDVPLSDYARFNRFLERQQALATLQRLPDVTVQLADGRSVTLTPQASRPLASLPFTFWLQVFVAIASWLVGAIIWSFRRNQPAALHLMIAGLGMLMMAASAAVYSTRELALPHALFRALSAINHGGALICAGAFIAVLCYYPRRLGSAWWGVLLVGSYALVWLADITQCLPFANRGVQAMILASVFGASALAIVQWRDARGDAVRRAALQWFLLSWFIGSSGFMLVVLIPALAGVDTGQLQAYGFGMMWLVSAGLALGVARYRLFDIERWWFRTLAVVAGGAAVIVCDLLFVSLLDLQQPAALILALALAGWLYFPLRQWLASRMFQRFGMRRMRDVPELLREIIADAPLEAERLLPESMNRLFAPLLLEPLGTPVTRMEIADHGTTLRVPGIGRWSGWAVRWPDNGNRLFSRQDARLADAVRAVLERVVTYQDIVEQSIERERTRVAADLHDDVGARLLTLLHRAEPEQAQAIRETLASLRLVVHGLGAKPQPLVDALAEWRAELHERCEAARVGVVWNEAEPLPEWRLDAPQQLHLARVLREAVSNALRHAAPTCIEVQLAADDDALLLSIANDGACQPPELWQAGNGLRSMRSRTQKLGGDLHIDAEHGRVVLRLRVPLVAEPPPSGADRSQLLG